MATIVVTSLSDTIAVDGVVTLREAIEAANTNAASGDAPAGSAGGDTIVFAVSGTIALGSSLSITENLVIDGGNAITLDGNNLTRPMTISNGADVTLKGLTVQNGYFAGAGGGINAGAGSDLTVINSTFSGNSGLNGGAIFAQGTLTAVNSTFDNNSAHGVGAAAVGAVRLLRAEQTPRRSLSIRPWPTTVQTSLAARSSPQRPSCSRTAPFRPTTPLRTVTEST